ncbi:survival motor neuron protein 1-like [Physella acuta]|uniref:survival motor neuron protein 1-like n=1 Tax=Physella acuta TaxID=109671 RepID=UPI0027DADA85|nr:survival motor neuron protein 1-like [Physella acuta]
MAGAESEYVLYQRGQEGESDAWDDTVLIKAYDNAVSAVKAKLAEQHPELSATQANIKPKKKKKSKAKTKKKHKHHGGVRWNVGDLCQAVYSVDGEVYEARILSIDEDKRRCTLQYVDYGNEEEQLLSNLIAPESGGSSQEQKTDTASETESLSRVPTVHETNFGKQKMKKSFNYHTAHNVQHAPKWPWNGYSQAPSFGPMTAPPPAFPPFQPPPNYPGYQASGPSTTPHLFPCVPPPPPLFSEPGPHDENEALYSMLISWYMSGYHTGYYQGLKQSSANSAAAAGHRFHR